MSLIPLMLGEYNISADYASWLASVFYGGLLIGAMFIERIVRNVGHRKAFIGCLAAFSLTIVALPAFPNGLVWLVARFIAGVAVAGVFVIVESWLMSGDEASRAKTPKPIHAFSIRRLGSRSIWYWRSWRKWRRTLCCDYNIDPNGDAGTDVY